MELDIVMPKLYIKQHIYNDDEDGCDEDEAGPSGDDDAGSGDKAGGVGEAGGEDVKAGGDDDACDGDEATGESPVVMTPPCICRKSLHNAILRRQFWEVMKDLLNWHMSSALLFRVRFK